MQLINTIGFSTFKKIANKVNLLFQHVDLFYTETRQEDFKKYF